MKVSQLPRARGQKIRADSMPGVLLVASWVTLAFAGCPSTGETDSGPGIDMNVPGSDMNVPGSDMNVPGSDMNVPGTDASPGTDAAPVDPCLGVTPTPGMPTLTAELVTGGLSSPVHVTAPPGDLDRVFVVERGGDIRIVDNGMLLSTPFLSIAVQCCGEQGLLSMAFHPDYASNGFFYVNYTAPGSGTTVVSRFTVGANPNVANAGSEMTIIQIPQFAGNHNGGQVFFGPDGYLWIGMGDGGGSNDPGNNGQDNTTLLGAMLRLDVDGGSPYAIPPSNPNAGMPLAVNGVCSMGPCPEIASIGVRNPWRFSFDRATGDLYIGDVGQNAMEEVDAVTYPGLGIGGDYGWDICEGTLGSCGGSIAPVATYPNPAEGCAVIGGFAYRGCAMPGYHGRYFYSDSCTSFLRSFVFNGSTATMSMDLSAAVSSLGSISSFGEDGRGEIYITDLGGSVYRLAPQ